jgi:RNA recognition motif-containing protein
MMGKRLYVGNLPYSADEARLKELFEAHGEVSEVNVIRDRFTEQHKGFAFVEMASDDEAGKAIGALDGTEMDGRQIKVNEAREREAGGGRSGGGGGGRY